MKNKEPVTRKIGTTLSLQKKFGKGDASKVRAGCKDGKEYAVKYTKILPFRKREDVHKSLAYELDALTALKHPNIIKSYGHEFSDHYIKQCKGTTTDCEVSYILLDIASLGCLYDVLALVGPLSEKMARFYFKQVLSAVKYMHDQDYSHRNISPKNIVLDSECNILLAGFRYSRRISTFCKASEEVPKLETAMCPQTLKSGKCHPIMDDLFALGYLLFFMLYNKPPFRKAVPENASMYNFVYNHQLESFWSQYPSPIISLEAKELISSMLAFEPTFRPSIYEIESSPWMQGETPTLEQVKSELTNMLKTIEAKLKEEALSRKTKRLQVSSVVTHGLYRSYTKTYEAKTYYDKSRSQKQKKTMEEANAEIVASTHVYSMENPDYIEESIAAYLAADATSFKIDNTSYKVSMK